MQQPTQLDILIIDDNQLYAERLVEVLDTHFYQKVNLGFLDAKEELIKLLRQSWDVLVMGKAYDLTLPQVVDIIKSHDIDLPVIAMADDKVVVNVAELSSTDKAQLDMIGEDDSTPPLVPIAYQWGAVDVLPKTELVGMALAIRQEHQQLLVRRNLAQLRQVLNDAEQRANILIKNSKSAVAYIQEGLHVYANDPYLKMFGFESLEDLMGVPVVDLIASNNIKDFKSFLKDFEKGNRSNVEFKFESIRTDGSTFAAKLQLAAATFEGEPCLQVIIQPNEQGNSAELAKKLAAMERIDQLTGIFNRKGFEQVLTNVREVVVQQSLQAGLMAIKIDDLGKINSSLGIQGVDETVLAITAMLKQKLAASMGEESISKGYLSRFNDNTFMVILPKIDQTALQAWAESIVTEVNDTIIEVGHRTVKATVTVGATMINNASPDMHALMDRVLQSVSIAIKQNNNEGNTFYLYDPAQFANSDDSALLEALKTALAEGKFNLLYQPVYDVEKDVSNLFEVFLRLPLADGTLMSPDKFIEVANQHELMDKIDRWVLIRACKDLKRYRSEVDPSARILVHLSPSSLTDETLPTFVTQLTRAIGGDSTEAINLQFSETMMTDYLAVAAKMTAELQQVNAGVGIYNFGSAVNALELLEFVKPNLVRLDRSYVKDLGNSDNVNTISSLINQISERNASCLMPFIEDPAAMSAAWTVGARYLQGDYLQPPSEVMHIQAEHA